ncbi:TRAP transporter substrate-binding protein [Pseudocitrobacter cyperus]|uniref:TRAP transporter substrate-binding protein n=1 Tax=Pseudocitrobacter cyperus TaxID=3112843 RepID=A0ABV0HEC5_9ENTR
MIRKNLSLALGVLLTCSFSVSSWAADVTLKLGHPVNEEHSWHKASLKFAEQVKQKTNGEVEVKVYPNESLGKEMDIINAIQLGSVDMTITGESLQNWAPSAALLGVPYMITSSEQMAKIVNGEVGAQIAKDIEEKAKLKTIAWFERGPRNLTANRPITNPSELKGLTLRLPNVPLFIGVWKELGAQPTPMAFSEVFTGLQQGVIEGQENPLSMIMSGSFFEVQKYLNRTEHVRGWIYLMMGSKKFNKLKPEYQQAILDAGKEAQRYEHELYLADEAKLIDTLQAKGMILVDVHQNEFAAIANKAVEKLINPQIKPLYEKARDTK